MSYNQNLVHDGARGQQLIKFRGICTSPPFTVMAKIIISELILSTRQKYADSLHDTVESYACMVYVR
jgi:hypothetical protein